MGLKGILVSPIRIRSKIIKKNIGHWYFYLIHTYIINTPAYYHHYYYYAWCSPVAAVEMALKRYQNEYCSIHVEWPLHQ